jgi:hypothetical protein
VKFGGAKRNYFRLTFPKMESLKGTSTLQDEWAKVKENLKGVDENIKKLYGRDPNQPRSNPIKRLTV